MTSVLPRGQARARPGRVRKLGRVEKLALKRPRHPVHGALADLARLAARLELGRDLLQKLRPAMLLDRLGQAP
jgi:hypothetical protein